MASYNKFDNNVIRLVLCSAVPFALLFASMMFLFFLNIRVLLISGTL